MLHKIDVGLVQINPVYNQKYFLPYSTGLLQAYAQQDTELATRYRFLSAIFSPLSLPIALEWLKSAKIVGFSAYVWNMQRSLAIAKALKQQNPDILIIFGGPEVPNQSEVFLREHPYVDVCCHGEGEQVFAALLAAYPSREWSTIPGISFLDTEDAYIQHPKAPRINDLTQLPSPYLTGVFQPFIAAHPHCWIGLWETNRGCPFSCTFCDWGSAIQSKVFTFDLERLFQEVQWFAQNEIADIYCCDANFGLLKRDLDIARYMNEVRLQYDYPRHFQVNTTKNQIERAYEIFKILSPMMPTGITLSLQSTSPETLKSVKRENISLDFYRELQHRLARDGIMTYADIILALPGETYQSFKEGVSGLLASGQYNQINFYNAVILPNSEMAEPEYRKKYGLVTTHIAMPQNLFEFEDGIQEFQEVLLATQALPTDDWIKSRIFAWTTTLLYFYLKLFQVPLVLLHEYCQIPHDVLIEQFITAAAQQYPTWHRIYTFFYRKAQAIQQGDSEMCAVPTLQQTVEWYLPEVLITQQLHRDQKEYQQFYAEGQAILQNFITTHQLDFPEDLLAEAIHFNQVFCEHRKRKIPSFTLPLSYNLWEIYQGALKGERVEWSRYELPQETLIEALDGISR